MRPDMAFAAIKRIARDYWASLAILAVIAIALVVLVLTSQSGNNWQRTQRAAQMAFDRHLRMIEADAAAANARNLSEQAASDRPSEQAASARQASASELVAAETAAPGSPNSGLASTGLPSYGWASTEPTGPRLEFSDLTAEPVVSTPSSCEGTFYPGEEVQISATGFLPGTPVRVFSAARDQSALEEELALPKADRYGGINTTVRIPPTARGLVPRGISSNVGLIFFFALGLGTDGVSHATAINMFELVPPGVGPCAAPSAGR